MLNPLLAGRAASPIDDFVAMIKRFGIEVERKDAYDAAFEIAKGSGLLRELYEDKTVEGLSRYENVQELLNAIKEFVDDPERQEKRLGAFLQEVSLVTGQDEDKDKDPDKVTLMTIHMAKGLEFRNVYIVGLEEDLFPITNDAQQPGRPGRRKKAVLRGHYQGSKEAVLILCLDPVPFWPTEKLRTKPVFWMMLISHLLR